MWLQSQAVLQKFRKSQRRASGNAKQQQIVARPENPAQVVAAAKSRRQLQRTKRKKQRKTKRRKKQKKLQTPESDEHEAARQVQLRKLGRQTEKPVLRGQKQDRSNQGRNGREWPMHQARKIKVFGQRPRQLQRISEKTIQSRRHRLASSECDLL